MPSSILHPPSSYLCLPSLSPAVPREYALLSGSGKLPDFTHWLVDAGVLRSLGKVADNSDLLRECGQALSAYAQSARPDPWFDFKLVFTDSMEELGYPGHSNWHGKHKLPDKTVICSLQLKLMGEPMAKNIGPKLRAMEKLRPRFGQTVLHTLDEALWRCCRGMTPRSGIGWAQDCYWMGEADESMRVEEDLLNDEERGPDGEIIKRKPEDWEGFRKANYDKSIPGWAGTGKIRPLKPAALARLRLKNKRARAIRDATLALMHGYKRSDRWDTWNNMEYFESCFYLVCPFLLQWNKGDVLPQIWDDVMNDHYNSGECSMDLNAVFAWHDRATCLIALHNLKRYLQLTQLCENLIRLL